VTLEEIKKIKEDVGEYVGSPGDACEIIITLCHKLEDYINQFGEL
jgi:hypothetical protein